MLRKLHTEHAAALVITTDQPSAAMHAVTAARSLPKSAHLRAFTR